MWSAFPICKSPQDDVLYEDLTVQETLSYAALLRLPRDMSRKEKLERVDMVIEALGITKSKNTIIGEGLGLTVRV